MWGFAVDSAAGKLCRVYAAVLGHLPKTCASGSGVPALALTAIVVLAVIIVAMVWSARARR